MDKNCGAYLIKDNENTETNILFIYKKLYKQKLMNALPISFDTEKYDNGSVYIGAIFKNGSDYIGQNDFNNIILPLNPANFCN